MVLNGEEEYIRSWSSLFGVSSVGDLGILTGAVKGLGVLCEMVRTGCSELVSLLTLFSFLASLSLSFFEVELDELMEETFVGSATAVVDEEEVAAVAAVFVVVILLFPACTELPSCWPVVDCVGF